MTEAVSVMLPLARPAVRGKLARGVRHMKLSTAVQQFIADCRVTLSASTVIAYESDLNHLVALATVEAADSVLAFTPDLVRAYFLMLSKKGLKMSTLHRRRSVLGEFAKWGLKQRLWASDPMASAPTIRRPKHLPRPFAPAERDRLLALTLGAEETLIRAILFWSGLRVSEVCGLRQQDVAIEAATLRVVGKGSKTRVVPMVPELVDAVKGWIWSPT